MRNTRVRAKRSNTVKYIVDHDIHIHTELSLCSLDPQQSVENIIKYAEKRGLKHICITDHLWDSSEIEIWNHEWWYSQQDFKYVTSKLPLPKSDTVNVHFGCETELDCNMVVGLHKKHFSDFEFIIIPTTHMHSHLVVTDEDYNSIERRKELYISRLDGLLDQDLPFEKIGIPHFTIPFIAGMIVNPWYQQPNWIDHLKFLDMIEDSEFERVFTKLAKKGAGLELNFVLSHYKTDYEKDCMLRPYRIAKKCGAKFYFGSDGHIPKDFEGVTENHEAIVEALGLLESDKFSPFK